MKKLVYIALITLVFTACGVYTTDLNRLTTGMSKGQVEAMIGRPDRVLSVSETRDGYQEVLQYRTSRNEVYALEFWNDYLAGYEYLYDDAPYIPAPAPPMYIPDYGRPIVIIDDRPGRPSRPHRPNRPNSGSRPGNSGRYQSGRVEGSSRPNSGRTSDGGRTSSGRTSTESSGRTSSSSGRYQSSGNTDSGSSNTSGRTSSSSTGKTSSESTYQPPKSTDSGSSNTSGKTSSGSTGRTSSGRTSGR